MRVRPRTKDGAAGMALGVYAARDVLLRELDSPFKWRIDAVLSKLEMELWRLRDKLPEKALTKPKPRRRRKPK